MWRLRFVALVIVIAAGCQPEPTDVREWRPSDHDNTELPTGPQVAVGDAAPRRAAPTPGLDDVTVLTWSRSCATCHGRIGRGDGPQAQMNHATNLADPTWQGSRSDEEIARVILRGKNAMPAFDLPEATVRGLVQLIRLFGGRLSGDAGNADAGAGDASTGSVPRAADAAARNDD